MWEWTDPNPKQIREKILKGGNAKKFDKFAIHVVLALSGVQ